MPNLVNKYLVNEILQGNICRIDCRRSHDKAAHWPLLLVSQIFKYRPYGYVANVPLSISCLSPRSTTLLFQKRSELYGWLSHLSRGWKLGCSDYRISESSQKVLPRSLLGLPNNQRCLRKVRRIKRNGNPDFRPHTLSLRRNGAFCLFVLLPSFFLIIHSLG